MSTETRRLYGRRQILSSVDGITSANIFEVLSKAYDTHRINRDEIIYLWNYYKGEQPILGKVKTVRPEINNKIVANHALEIVDFKKGYVFGEPIQFVRRSDDESTSDAINFLNEFMIEQDKFSQDEELAEWLYVVGLGYRLVFPESDPDAEAPFYIKTLDPKYTFVIYKNDIKKEPLMGVTYTEDENGLPEVFYCYTENKYYEVKMPKGEKASIQAEADHYLRHIPIIEYPANNRLMGAFEPVLPLLDALNSTVSSRMDGIEQFVQSFMKFINCDIDIDTFKEFKDLGAIKINTIDGSRPADVDIVSSELNQTQAQVGKEDLYQTLLIICGMPDRKTTKSGGDTGQAVILRDGWGSAEAMAKLTEVKFKKSERMLLRIILHILENDQVIKSNLKIADVDIKFTRNKTDSLLVKTQGLSNLLASGIAPQIAIQNVGLFSDPEQVYVDSKEYLRKWEYKEQVKIDGTNLTEKIVEDVQDPTKNSG